LAIPIAMWRGLAPAVIAVAIAMTYLGVGLVEGYLGTSSTSSLTTSAATSGLLVAKRTMRNRNMQGVQVVGQVPAAIHQFQGAAF